MLTVAKFGGTSLANAECFLRVQSIVDADESRRIIVPSAPGKEHSDDIKITDLLYLLHETIEVKQDPDDYKKTQVVISGSGKTGTITYDEKLMASRTAVNAKAAAQAKAKAAAAAKAAAVKSPTAPPGASTTRQPRMRVIPQPKKK